MKYTPYILAVITIVLIYFLFFVFKAYGDYIELYNLKINTDEPLVCIVEPTDKQRFYSNIFNATLNAVEEWERNTHFKIWYHVVTHEEQFQYTQSQYVGCYVFIFYSEEINGSIAGETSFDHRSSKHKFAEIMIYLNEYKNTMVIGNKTTIPVSSIMIETVIKHEFGHALGLGHFFQTQTDENIESIMRPFLYKGEKYNVTDFDAEAVKFLYESKYPVKCYTRNNFECK